jgi:hypothetical protein
LFTAVLRLNSKKVFLHMNYYALESKEKEEEDEEEWDEDIEEEGE